MPMRTRGILIVGTALLMLGAGWFFLPGLHGDGGKARSSGRTMMEIVSLVKKATSGDRQALSELGGLAKTGDPNAQYFLGLMTLNGEGVHKNPPEGVGWLLRAANQGQADAQNELGAAYLDGLGSRSGLCTGL